MSKIKENIIYLPIWELKYGGPVTSIYSLLKIIGKDFTLVSKSFECDNKNIKYLHNDQSFINAFQLLFSPLLFKFIFSKKQSCLFINGCWDSIGLLFLIIGIITRRSIIIHPRGMLLKDALKKNKFFKYLILYLIYKPLENFFELFLCSSKKEKEDLANIFPRNKIIILPNYQDLPNIKNKRIKQNNNQKKSLLFLSRINPKKGILELLEAWNKVNMKNWELIICGPIENEFKNTFYKKLKQVNNDNYKYIGSINFSERFNVYKSSDAFILPSYHENFGNVILEALHIGLPTITTYKTPWVKIEENNCGKLINPSVEEIKKALNWLDSLNDFELVKMSERAELLSQEFNITNHFEKISLIFKLI